MALETACSVPVPVYWYLELWACSSGGMSTGSAKDMALPSLPHRS